MEGQPGEGPLWIVRVRTRSAVRFDGVENIYVEASDQSDVPVVGIQWSNELVFYQDAPDERLATGLIGSAVGFAPDMEGAIDLLANQAAPHLQLFAVAANAAVDDIDDIRVYRPPASPEERGQFLVQRVSHPEPALPVTRSISAANAMAVLTGVEVHPRRDRLHRAIAHYRAALVQLDHMGGMTLAVQSLFIASEALVRAITARIAVDLGLDPDDSSTKHQLALASGIEPASAKDRTHLGRFDSWVRRELVFGGDAEICSAVAKLSDGWEHGYMDFGQVRDLAQDAGLAAFRHIRNAILMEAGIEEGHALRDARYDHPLGMWRPMVEVEGTYEDSTAQNPVPFVASEPWPATPSPNFAGIIDRVREIGPDSRQVTLRIKGDMQSLTEHQRLWVQGTRWLLPSGKSTQSTHEIEDVEIVINSRTGEERAP